MAYVKQDWENLPAETTPLSAERLAHMETQYDEALSTLQPIISEVTTGRLSPSGIDTSIAEATEGKQDAATLDEDSAVLVGDPLSQTGNALVDNVNNPASALGLAVRAASREYVVIPVSAFGPGDNRPATIGPWSSSTNSTNASPAIYYGPDTTQQVAAVVELPTGWNTGRLSIFWAHKTASPTGSVRWIPFIRVFGAGTNLSVNGSAQENIASATAGQNNVLRADFNNFLTPALTADAQMVQLSIVRAGDSTSDTFTGQCAVLAVMLERTS